MRHVKLVPDAGHPKNAGNLATCGVCGVDRWAKDLVQAEIQVRGGGKKNLWVCKEQGRCYDPPHRQNEYGTRNDLELPPLVRQRL